MHRGQAAISGHSEEKPDATREKEGFRPDIEGLRGVAVSLVLLFHAGLLSNSAVQLTGGFIGVDLFFVVSGFLITGLLIRERERSGRISFSRFYARRVRRILPAAAVTLLITLPLSYGLINLVERPAAIQDGASAALSIANIRFALTTDYFHPANYSPFLHFWSLGVEEQFYFVWPALLAIVAWKWPRAGSVAALSVVIATSLAASLVITDSSPSTAFYMLPTRAWQLGAGGLLALSSGSLDGVPGVNRVPGAIRARLGGLLPFAGWAALAALITAAVAIDNLTTPYPGTAAIVPTLAGVLLIASGTEPAGPGVLLRLPPVRFLGKISYSLYLWHWPMLILGGLYLVGPMGTLTPTQALVLIGLSIPVATASWLLVEEPFRRGKIPLPRPSRVVGVGVAAMLAVALMGSAFNLGAESALVSLGGGDSDDSTAPPATAYPTPAAWVVPGTLAPNTIPTPVPEMTPALTPGPTLPPPTTYAITSAIHPALGRAAIDYEQPWRDHCTAGENDKVPKAEPACTYGDPSGIRTVALIGDSHASALFPGVNAVAQAHGWKLIPYLKFDCPFLDLRIVDNTLKREYAECETWNSNVLKRLAADPPNLVIISMSRWIHPIRNADDTVERESAALIRMIQKLPVASPVAIISDPPLPARNVLGCLGTYTRDYRKCAYPRSAGFGWEMGSREQKAAAATGAGLIDLSSEICPGTGDCPVVINNMIVWRDGHHLTATFSASLGPAIDAQLVDFLDRWTGPAPTPS